MKERVNYVRAEGLETGSEYFIIDKYTKDYCYTIARTLFTRACTDTYNKELPDEHRRLSKKIAGDLLRLMNTLEAAPGGECL